MAEKIHGAYDARPLSDALRGQSKVIEIYEVATGKVVETQELDAAGLRAFRVYWDRQSGPEFSWRILGGTGREFQRRILKDQDGLHCINKPLEFLPFDDATIAEIARRNERMTPDEVRAALNRGSAVYTTFSRYRLEA